jgi:hypothetical protein
MARTLALLPMSEVDPRLVAAAVARAARAGSVVHGGAVLGRSDLGRIDLFPVLQDTRAGPVLGLDSWRRLIFVMDADPGPSRDGMMAAGVSQSFLDDLHSALRSCRLFLALLATDLQPQRLVDELDRLPVRLIYGAMPDAAMTRAGADQTVQLIEDTSISRSDSPCGVMTSLRRQCRMRVFGRLVPPASTGAPRPD